MYMEVHIGLLLRKIGKCLKHLLIKIKLLLLLDR